MSKKRILIVEDEAIISMHLQHSLETQGYEIVDIVITGEDAITKAREKDIDIILLDIKLADDIDGITAIEEIQKFKDIPFILVTAHSDEKTLERIKKTEPYGYIVKPVNQNELNSTIEIALYKFEIEKKLKESEARYFNLFNKTNSCVAIFRPVDNGNDFIIIDFNRNAEETDKKKREDIIGKSVIEVFPGIIEFGLLDVFKHVWKTGSPQKHPMTFYRDSNISGWRENYIYKLPSDEIVTIYEDSTKSIEQQKELQLFKKITATLNEAIGIRDTTGTLIYINRAYEKLFGWNLEEAKQLKYQDYYAPESLDTLHNIIAPALARGHSWEGVLDVFDASGRRFPLWKHAGTVHDENDNILFNFCIMHEFKKK